MAIQVSKRLSFQQAEALLYMMGADKPRTVLYQALEKPDTDTKAKGQIWARYFSADNEFTVTFR